MIDETLHEGVQGIKKWADSLPKTYKAVNSDLLVILNYLLTENAKLKAQLTWRPVSEKPEKGTWTTLRRIVDGKLDDKLMWFYHLENVADWETVVATLDATHWLPIPPTEDKEI